MADHTYNNKLLYAEEHMYCKNHCQKGKPVIRFFNMDTGKEVKYTLDEHVILFIRKGEVDLEWPEYKQRRRVGENGFILLPSYAVVAANVQKETEVMVCRFTDNLKLCDMLKLNPDSELSDNDEILYANNIIKKQIDTIKHCMGLGVMCKNYQSIKVLEILYMFRFFYTKEKLTAFFKAILMNRDMAFKGFILSNWDTVNSIEELAGKANYHRDTFARKFYKVMGTTPGQWMKEKKAELIMQELRFSSKPLKQIAEDLDFSSPAALNTFCKRRFNDTPANIRNRELGIKK